MKIRKTAIAAACVLLLAMLFGCGVSEGTTYEAFDFFERSSDGLPLGWSVVSYENLYEVACDGSAVTISTEVADDVRLVHQVPVSGGTHYVLEADVAVENVIGGEGATLSIDNYGIDGSYIYSNGVYGTKDWTHVELAFVTDSKQDTVQIALRLGGYSNQSSGLVRFRNVVLRSSDQASVSFQRLSVRSSSQDSDLEKSSEQYDSYFSLIFWETIFAAAALGYGVYLHRDRLQKAEISTQKKRFFFAWILLIGFAIRFSLCAVLKGHATDMNCWIAWGNQIVDGKFSTFYDGTWYDYPPGYMLFLGLLTVFLRIIGISAWGGETLVRFCYMLPAFACDIGCALLVMRFAKEQNRSEAFGLLLGGLIVLNPAVMYLSGAWGQIDSVLTFLLLLAFEAFRKEKRILCAVWYALAILTKWQALIYGPVLAMVYIATLLTEKDGKKQKKQLIRTGIAVAVAFAILFVVSLPFRGNMSVFWLVERFLSASSGYDYATVEGYNFFALLGANWRKAGVDVLNGTDALGAVMLSFGTLGKLLLPMAVCTLSVAAWQELRDAKKRTALLSLGFLLIAAVLIKVFGMLTSNVETIKWVLYAAAAAIAMLGWILQNTERGGLRAFLRESDLAFYSVFVSILSAAVVTALLTLRFAAQMLGGTLTYSGFGSLMIGLAVVAALIMLLRYARTNRLQPASPEPLYLTAACFMVWVFTFGQYMHERYVLPVLILLLFVYAITEDKHILLAALLLTVSTFLNEMVAMYVVSDGAITAIRGGERHNLFLQWCSALEVLSALYLTVTVARRLVAAPKGGDVK